MFGRRRKQSDFEAEIEAHLQLDADDLKARGLSDEEARDAARRAFGNLGQARERFYEAGRVAAWDQLIQDLRFGLRQLRKNRGFTAVAVLTLALGIGLNAAVFSVVHAVLMKPLPYREPDDLVIVWEQNPSRGWTTNIVSAANFSDWRKQNQVFSGMAAVDPLSFNLSDGGEPLEIDGERATANLFSLLGVQPIKGRGFQPEDERPGSAPVAVVSYGFWQQHYGGDPGLVGRTIMLDGHSYPVVGIMRADLSDAYTTFFKTNAKVWISGLDLSDPVRDDHQFLALARLKPGVTVAGAQTEMNTIATQLEKQYPENKGWGVEVIRVRDQVVRYVSRALTVLMGAVTLVLLITCVNLANLLVSRGSTREREVAIRTAIGAGRFRIVCQLLTESLLLAALGGLLGLGLARSGLTFLLSLAPADMPGIGGASLNGTVLIFAALATFVTGLLFGIVPALTASRLDLNDSLKGGSRDAVEDRAGIRLRGLLVAAEFALAVVLVTGATLMIKTLVHLARFDPGFNPDRVLTLRVPLRGPQYNSHEKEARFFEQVLARAASLPGVEAASVASGLPIENHSGMGFVTEHDPNPAPGQMPDANYLVIGPDYFRTLGIPIRRGRAFTGGDTTVSQRAVVVNEELVRRHWPGQDGIGKRLRTGSGMPWLTVVGVAANVRTTGPDGDVEPELYVAYTQPPWLLSPRILVVRTSVPPLTVAPALAHEVLSLDPGQPVSDARTLDVVAGQPAEQRRFLMVMLGLFGGLAVTLAAVGVYGVLAFSVARRRHEIGIRIALGAAQRDVMKLVLARGFLLAGDGLAAGLAAALLLARLLDSLLFGVSPADPATYVFVAALLSAVALVACYLPARRASRVEPSSALRCE